MFRAESVGADALATTDRLVGPAMLVATMSQYEKTAFVVVCRDGPNGPLVRATYTPEHMAYVETVMDELNVAGPLYDNGADHADSAPIGSLYCLHTKSLQRAREIIESDPYFKHGAFASVEYFPHLPAAGRYIGGKIW